MKIWNKNCTSQIVHVVDHHRTSFLGLGRQWNLRCINNLFQFLFFSEITNILRWERTIFIRTVMERKINVFEWNNNIIKLIMFSMKYLPARREAEISVVLFLWLSNEQIEDVLLYILNLLLHHGRQLFFFVCTKIYN